MSQPSAAWSLFALLAACASTTTSQLTRKPAPTPTRLAAPLIALSEIAACAIRGAGDVRCWGAGPALGDGTGYGHGLPLPVIGLPVNEAYRSLSVADSHACAVTRGGQLWCWGASRFVRPDGKSDGIMTARQLPELGKVDRVIVRNAFACALGSDRRVRCWGDGEVVEVEELGETRQLFAFSSNGMCAEGPDAKWRCWTNPNPSSTDLASVWEISTVTFTFGQRQAQVRCFDSGAIMCQPQHSGAGVLAFQVLDGKACGTQSGSLFCSRLELPPRDSRDFRSWLETYKGRKVALPKATQPAALQVATFAINVSGSCAVPARLGQPIRCWEGFSRAPYSVEWPTRSGLIKRLRSSHIKRQRAWAAASDSMMATLEFLEHESSALAPLMYRAHGYDDGEAYSSTSSEMRRQAVLGLVDSGHCDLASRIFEQIAPESFKYYGYLADALTKRCAASMSAVRRDRLLKIARTGALTKGILGGDLYSWGIAAARLEDVAGAERGGRWLVEFVAATGRGTQGRGSLGVSSILSTARCCWSW